ncbi:MAG: CpaF family protein [Lachnospiraceae bacterium]|nr:CpaF family protein [Lachnospiraceae bacterium]
MREKARNRTEEKRWEKPPAVSSAVRSCLEEDCRQEILRRAAREKEISDEGLYAVIDQVLAETAKERYLSLADRGPLRQRLFDAFRRLDILQELLEDETITEIMVNGHRDIFVERGGRVFRWERGFENRQKLEDVIQQIVARVNRVVNESAPIVDARLPDGSRVNVVLPPVALGGPALTIRKFSQAPVTMEQLIGWNSIGSQPAAFLKTLVQARYNIFISGGTGSGKTTFLNALSQFIPDNERVITIEDSAELRLVEQPDLIRMETRTGSTDTAISIRQLIRCSLRMNPDRIIVGEVRGEEALDMLQAMNTGHDGSLSTGHANSPSDMLMRLATMVLMGAELPLAAINAQIASAIDILVHLGKLRDGSRKVLSIMEVGSNEGGTIRLNPIYEFAETGVDEQGQIRGEWRRQKNGLTNVHKLALAGLPDLL